MTDTALPDPLVLAEARRGRFTCAGCFHLRPRKGSGRRFVMGEKVRLCSKCAKQRDRRRSG